MVTWHHKYDDRPQGPYRTPDKPPGPTWWKRAREWVKYMAIYIWETPIGRNKDLQVLAMCTFGLALVAAIVVAIIAGSSTYEERVFNGRCLQRCRVESGDRQYGSDQAKCICVAKGGVLIEYEIEVPRR